MKCPCYCKVSIDATYVRMYVCTYVRMYVCTYVRMYVCTYVRMYVPNINSVRLFVCPCVGRKCLPKREGGAQNGRHVRYSNFFRGTFTSKKKFKITKFYFRENTGNALEAQSSPAGARSVYGKLLG